MGPFPQENTCTKLYRSRDLWLLRTTYSWGTLFAPFWCLCQKLSLSPLHFNKTLLHTHTHTKKNYLLLVYRRPWMPSWDLLMPGQVPGWRLPMRGYLDATHSWWLKLELAESWTILSFSVHLSKGTSRPLEDTLVVLLVKDVSCTLTMRVL